MKLALMVKRRRRLVKKGTSKPAGICHIFVYHMKTQGMSEKVSTLIFSTKKTFLRLLKKLISLKQSVDFVLTYKVLSIARSQV